MTPTDFFLHMNINMTNLLLILLLFGNFVFAEDKFPTINIKASKKQLNNMTTADKLTLYNMEKKSFCVGLAASFIPIIPVGHIYAGSSKKGLNIICDIKLD